MTQFPLPRIWRPLGQSSASYDAVGRMARRKQLYDEIVRAAITVLIIACLWGAAAIALLIVVAIVYLPLAPMFLSAFG